MSTGIISTIAGTGVQGYNGDGIAATTAELSNPNEVSFDANGNLYIADWNNNRVRKIDKTTGIITTVVGTGTGGYNGDGIVATSAQINAPCGIIFDAAGNMYVAEYSGYRVRKISVATNLISTIVGTATGGYNGDGIPANTAELYGPAYIRFDNAGNMFIGDSFNERVREISATTGLISTVAGNGTNGYNGDGISPTTAELSAPFCIYFDKIRCCLYIADYQNARIREVTGGLMGGCTPPVAPGNLISCQVLPAVTIDAANNSSWVSVYDSSGNIAAQINANGNNLGLVNTSLYTKTGPCRQDNLFRLYLNRNITITPQNQPASGTVALRLYLKNEELDSLETAINTLGESSGVSSINELGVFKNEDACSTIGANMAPILTTTAAVYNSDYYVQTSVSGFSSFYLASNLLTTLLRATISSFTGKRADEANILTWQANGDGQVIFGIERSLDGINFVNIGWINSTSESSAPYSFADRQPSASAQYNYYRLSITEDGKAISYSAVIALSGDKNQGLQITVQPNIIHGSVIGVQVSSLNPQPVEFTIADITGRIIFHHTASAGAGTNRIFLHPGSLLSGTYWVRAVGADNSMHVSPFIME